MKLSRKTLKDITRLSSKHDTNVTIKRICGELIGEGSFRNVYVLKLDPRFVVKVERDMSRSDYSNATEWRNYINNKDWTYLKDWLAPCELISESGQLMVQQRVNWDGKRRKDYPKYIPHVFTDTKLKNFGWIGDRFVCCDYSYLKIMIKSDKDMKYAKWFGSLKHRG
jgi:hypothetical protein